MTHLVVSVELLMTHLVISDDLAMTHLVVCDNLVTTLTDDSDNLTDELLAVYLPGNSDLFWSLKATRNFPTNLNLKDSAALPELINTIHIKQYNNVGGGKRISTLPENLNPHEKNSNSMAKTGGAFQVPQRDSDELGMQYVVAGTIGAKGSGANIGDIIILIWQS